MKRHHLAVYVLLLVGSLSCFAQDSLNVRKIGEYRAYYDQMRDFSIYDGLACIVTRTGDLDFVDVADASAPHRVAFLAGQQAAGPVALYNDWGYAVAGGNLRVIDLHDPSNPVCVAVLTTPGGASDVAIQDSFLYVADGLSGLRVYRLDQSAFPAAAGGCVTEGIASELRLRGHRAYVRNAGSDLQIFDISNPTQPQPIGSIPVGFDDMEFDVNGPMAYIVSYDNGQLQIVDVSDSDSAVERSEISVLPDYYRPAAIRVSGSYAYLGDQSGFLSIIDVAQAAAPYLYRRLPLDDYLQQVRIVDSYLVTGFLYSGLRIMDLTNPCDPVETGRYQFPSDLRNISALRRPYAFVDDEENGMVIMDVSNPARPVPVNTYRLPGFGVRSAICGDYAYVTAETLGVHVLDIHDPQNPLEVGRLAVPAVITNILVDGNLAYISDRDTLRIVNVRNPQYPFEISRLQFADRINEVVSLDSLLYVFGGGSEIWIVDIHDPAAPEITGFFVAGSMISDMVVSGQYAYLAAGTRFTIFEISNPRIPTILSQTVAAGTVWDVAVEDGFAYLRCSQSRISVYDVHDPFAQVETGYYMFPGESYDIAAEDGIVCVSERSSFSVLDCAEALQGSPAVMDALPAIFALHPAFPNPFNATTRIAFDLPRAAEVELKLFDITGRLVRTLSEQRFDAGSHAISFDGIGIATGIYFVRLSSGEFSQSQKLVLVK